MFFWIGKFLIGFIYCLNREGGWESYSVDKPVLKYYMSKISVFHRYCLFVPYPGGKLEDYNFYRLKPFKNGTAICFGRWKLVRVNSIIPDKDTWKSSNLVTWYGNIEIVTILDLKLEMAMHELYKLLSEIIGKDLKI